MFSTFVSNECSSLKKTLGRTYVTYFSCQVWGLITEDFIRLLIYNVDFVSWRWKMWTDLENRVHVTNSKVLGWISSLCSIYVHYLGLKLNQTGSSSINQTENEQTKLVLMALSQET